MFQKFRFKNCLNLTQLSRLKLAWPSEKTTELNAVQLTRLALWCFGKVRAVTRPQNKTLHKRQGMEEVMKLKFVLRRIFTEHGEEERGRNFKRKNIL
jgi:hypothetical protein